jgi:monothiol glutaredoxin
MNMAHTLFPEVEKLVKNNEVVIYMKGSPDFPMCGFSARAVAVLKAAGASKLASFDVLSDDDMWTALEEYTQWPTVPQIFIKGKFVGGCDIVSEMFERGELQDVLKA